MPYFSYEGKSVFYRDEGKGDLLLLLPGNTASSASHDGEMEFFAQSFRVICPDYVGYGKSARVERFPVDFWWYNAEMCVELIRSLAIDEFIAIGTSGGGIIALNVGIIAGKLLKCLVADSIPGEIPRRDEIKEWIRANEMMTEDQISFWRQAHGEDWAHIVKLDILLMAEAAGKSLYKNRLGEVQCPVLLTASLSDDGIADIGIKMCDIARKVQSAKSVFFSAGGHPLMWSRPHEFRTEVIRFFNDNCITMSGR